ncbi:hypothetical protein [Blastococcus deserti]|uniref:Uncharacterized protein n=1 Tax=Blastococcus deserti TaxID=2259033 RepID=A0ABW4X797_9ACTN
MIVPTAAGCPMPGWCTAPRRLDDLTVRNAFSSASAPGLLHALDAAVPLFADAL